MPSDSRPAARLRALTRDELARRLAEADRVRAQLRRTTLEMRALGDRILADRKKRS